MTRDGAQEAEAPISDSLSGGYEEGTTDRSLPSFWAVLRACWGLGSRKRLDGAGDERGEEEADIISIQTEENIDMKLFFFLKEKEKRKRKRKKKKKRKRVLWLCLPQVCLEAVF